MDESQLVMEVCRGDFQAATALVDRFYEKVYAFLRRLAGNDADAADLTQKTFARLWPALPQFAGRSSVGSFIHGIAYHVYQDYLRSNHRTESRSEVWWQERPDERPGPDQQASERDLSATVHAAVAALEPDLRNTVHLHYYQGLTLEETAQILAVASSTVKFRLRSALLLLKSQLNEETKLSAQLS